MKPEHQETAVRNDTYMDRDESISKDIHANKMLRLGILILIFTLWSFAGIGKVLAKHVIQEGTPDSARVAMMHVDGNIYKVDLSDIEKPGDYIDLPLKVTGTSEVSMHYRFSSELNGSMPLIVKITRNPGGTVVLQTTIAELDAAIQAQYAGDDDAMPFVKLGDISDSIPPNSDINGVYGNYTLHVEWPVSENDLEYPYSRSVLTLKLNAEQID